jgi:hypothetical protein
VGTGVAFNNTGQSIWAVPSDQQLKTNVQPFTYGLAQIRQINPVSFEYNGLGGTVPGQSHIGFIAQHVQPVAPYLVDEYQGQLYPSDTAATTLLSANSGPLLYVAINAIQELDSANAAKDSVIAQQQAQLAELSTRLDALDALIRACCEANSTPQARTVLATATQPDAQSGFGLRQVRLYPNPTTGRVKVEYQLEGLTPATIRVMDLNGRIVMERSIRAENGIEELDLSGQTSGTYLCTVLSGGEIVAVSKVVLNR